MDIAARLGNMFEGIAKQETGGDVEVVTSVALMKKGKGKGGVGFD